MGKRDEQHKLKLCILQKIKEKRDLLFGVFSNSLSKLDKVQEWKEVHSYAQALGAIPLTKDWTYLRDVWWPNVRKATVEKNDNSKRTGTGGGPDAKLTNIDEEVLSIIGKDSPTVSGLDVPESMEAAAEPVVEEDLIETEEECFISPETSTYDFTATRSKTRHRTERNNRKSSYQNISLSESDKAEDSLKKRKLELSVEILEKESYLKSLEILKLERELGLSPSKFTEGFPDTARMYVIQSTGSENTIVDGDSQIITVHNGSI